MAALEKTLVLIKPDAVQRSLIGEITSRLERTGLKLVAMKMVWANKDLSNRHYAEHLGKYFYQRIEDMITEVPLVAMVWEGHYAPEVVRKMVGATYPKDAAPGTIRGDLAHVSGNPFNLIHASANLEEAKREIGLWFQKNEMYSYERNDERHVLGPTDDDLKTS
jgi:nucleoside-diphosphate kinase